MRSFEVDVDVSAAAGLGSGLQERVAVHLPDEIRGPVVVAFGYPGGGFGRKYYDMQTLPGYSQAEFHVSRSMVFVACDHLGVGESSQPDPLDLTFENLAAANHAAATTVLDGLRAGTLLQGIGPAEITSTFAMGQSMGGCLLTVQQSNHATFDGVALLGWSGVYTNFPAPDGSRITYPMPPRGTDLRPIAEQLLNTAPDEDHFRFCFHWPDEEAALMEADLSTFRPYTGVVRGDAHTPWGSSTIPPCAITMMTPGAVTPEAAAIQVPVLVGTGERDVVPDLWAEPAAYRGSRDVSIIVIPRMSHMHNFARTRAKLWERIHQFGESVNARIASRE